MHIILGIILFVALAAAWESKGPAWVLKAIGWTAAGITGLVVIVIVSAEVHQKTKAAELEARVAADKCLQHPTDVDAWLACETE